MTTGTGRQAGMDWLVCVLAAAATGLGATDTLASWLPHPAIPALAVVQGLILLARRRAPVPALAGTTAVALLLIVGGYPAGGAVVGTFFAAYAVAMYWGSRHGRCDVERTEHAGRARFPVASAAMVAATALALSAANLAPDARGSGLNSVGLAVASAWILGYALRTRRAYVAELVARAARLEAEEGERAARAVAEERLRIARELHDVVGHSISLITVQAEAATRSVRTNPDAVPPFLATISATGREALAEMRRVLAVLRPDAEPEMSPQPGLGDLGELVARFQDGGLRVSLDAPSAELPPGVGLAVYRIVQESLTNVLKHAGPGVRAVVAVEPGAGSVLVSVLDDGRGPTAPASGAAHGIVGMRERVAIYGGTLRVGPGPRRGFQVRAVIPLPEEEAR
ncbi:sensor histidine kinase [Catenulispora sp. NL8]|uniref:histidine kinase n=1 Tax=Catenulispora pinistramenti TaxID=2705254 RepID=A0ABS5KIP8_9ACTN|nr:sensor histidine kinase [Catenulispora pinistramenti]MBS2545880.1 sensor histidine kinase [Catenulispora pinistramenti]